MAAGFDTSIYKVPEQPDPLNRLTGLLQMQGALQEQEIQRETLNRLRSEQAAGQAYQQAVGPDGQVDVNKLGGIIAKDPNAAYSASQALRDATSLRGGQIGNQQAGTDLGITRQNQISNGLAGLNSKPDLSEQDALGYLDQQVKAGVIPAEQGQQIAGEIKAIGGDRRRLREYVFNHYATVVGPAASAPTAVGVTSSGAPLVGTQGGLVRATTASTQNPAGVGGRAAPTGIQVGLAPGDAEARSATAKASADQGIKLQTQAEGIPTRKGMLANLEDAIDHFKPGKGAEWENVAKNFANRNILPTAFQFDPKSIASQEEFNKQATQLAQQQFQALGGTGTDSQLSSAFKSNPNSELSKMGNKQIIQLLKGNEDALAAKNAEWQKWQRQYGPNDYGAFQEAFNKTYNPRVYQAQYMTPEQIQDMRKNMSEKDQAQFLKDYVALKRQGYITFGGKPGAQ
ncbi:hypothetical protein [Methylorubrum extorquens]|uniref:Uncharacterized protein n=1 Tax=Methylorubrum extorquens (strain ATCC 14718 / DSM 1338 / JCM 2805 / NCIMB 9133 / AM1) TaxID=272630 RepID=C5B182_METEA|nr:hypothetical protein [Methylorubrum extorquens]ACS41683.1 Hypothetical protein MexAM1_META1p4004 [Methylorubrum extorquens AM1]MCP1545304.1 type II secretory pathway pseudopilin PulG [Methylorubrum extorquens]MCP1587349.1 type II secretory pathway pseudopilin PulG [Methylorubrum extorquens]